MGVTCCKALCTLKQDHLSSMINESGKIRIESGTYDGLVGDYFNPSQTAKSVFIEGPVHFTSGKLVKGSINEGGGAQNQPFKHYNSAREKERKPAGQTKSKNQQRRKSQVAQQFFIKINSEFLECSSPGEDQQAPQPAFSKKLHNMDQIAAAGNQNYLQGGTTSFKKRSASGQQIFNDENSTYSSKSQFVMGSINDKQSNAGSSANEQQNQVQQSTHHLAIPRVQQVVRLERTSKKKSKEMEPMMIYPRGVLQHQVTEKWKKRTVDFQNSLLEVVPESGTTNMPRQIRPIYRNMTLKAGRWVQQGAPEQAPSEQVHIGKISAASFSSSVMNNLYNNNNSVGMPMRPQSSGCNTSNERDPNAENERRQPGVDQPSSFMLSSLGDQTCYFPNNYNLNNSSPHEEIKQNNRRDSKAAFLLPVKKETMKSNLFDSSTNVNIFGLKGEQQSVSEFRYLKQLSNVSFVNNQKGQKQSMNLDPHQKLLLPILNDNNADASSIRSPQFAVLKKGQQTLKANNQSDAQQSQQLLVSKSSSRYQNSGDLEESSSSSVSCKTSLKTCSSIDDHLNDSKQEGVNFEPSYQLKLDIRPKSRKDSNKKQKNRQATEQAKNLKEQDSLMRDQAKYQQIQTFKEWADQEKGELQNIFKTTNLSLKQDTPVSSNNTPVSLPKIEELPVTLVKPKPSIFIVPPKLESQQTLNNRDSPCRETQNNKIDNKPQEILLFESQNQNEKSLDFSSYSSKYNHEHAYNPGNRRSLTPNNTESTFAKDKATKKRMMFQGAKKNYNSSNVNSDQLNDRLSITNNQQQALEHSHKGGQPNQRRNSQFIKRCCTQSLENTKKEEEESKNLNKNDLQNIRMLEKICETVLKNIVVQDSNGNSSFVYQDSIRPGSSRVFSPSANRQIFQLGKNQTAQSGMSKCQTPQAKPRHDWSSQSNSNANTEAAAVPQINFQTQGNSSNSKDEFKIHIIAAPEDENPYHKNSSFNSAMETLQFQDINQNDSPKFLNKMETFKQQYNTILELPEEDYKSSIAISDKKQIEEQKGKGSGNLEVKTKRRCESSMNLSAQDFSVMSQNSNVMMKGISVQESSQQQQQQQSYLQKNMLAQEHEHRDSNEQKAKQRLSKSSINWAKDTHSPSVLALPQSRQDKKDMNLINQSRKQTFGLDKDVSKLIPETNQNYLEAQTFSSAIQKAQQLGSGLKQPSLGSKSSTEQQKQTNQVLPPGGVLTNVKATDFKYSHNTPNVQGRNLIKSIKRVVKKNANGDPSLIPELLQQVRINSIKQQLQKQLNETHQIIQHNAGVFSPLETSNITKISLPQSYKRRSSLDLKSDSNKLTIIDNNVKDHGFNKTKHARAAEEQDLSACSRNTPNNQDFPFDFSKKMYERIMSPVSSDCTPDAQSVFNPADYSYEIHYNEESQFDQTNSVISGSSPKSNNQLNQRDTEKPKEESCAMIEFICSNQHSLQKPESRWSSNVVAKSQTNTAIATRPQQLNDQQLIQNYQFKHFVDFQKSLNNCGTDSSPSNLRTNQENKLKDGYRIQNQLQVQKNSDIDKQDTSQSFNSSNFQDDSNQDKQNNHLKAMQKSCYTQKDIYLHMNTADSPITIRTNVRGAGQGMKLDVAPRPSNSLSPYSDNQSQYLRGDRTQRSITTMSAISTKVNGKKLINQYMIIKTVGRGKFAKVAKCMDQNTKEIFAMKVMNKAKLKKIQIGKNKYAYSSVETEIAILKKLEHPNIVRLFEIIDDPKHDKLYLITDFVTNGTLQEMITKKSSQVLTEELCRRYFRQLISALEYCHENAKIIHRDIKPENILVEADFESIKLSDFGVSFMMENGVDDISTSAGSYYYYSPEACLGATYKGKKSDLWACGVTLYFMIYKQHPFEAKLIPDLFKKIQSEEPTYRPAKSQQMTFEVTPQLKDLVKKILTKNAENRITLSEIKKHPWITKNGEEPMPELERVDLEATEQDKQNAIQEITKIGQVILKKISKLIAEDLSSKNTSNQQKQEVAVAASKTEERQPVRINSNQLNILTHLLNQSHSTNGSKI